MTSKRIGIVVAAVTAAALLAWWWTERAPSEADDRKQTSVTPGDTPAVVALVKRRDMGDTLTVAGAFKPFQDVDVHAKVAGYIRKIYVDVGDHVKEGQTLAVLEVPELAAQLTGADAAARRASEEIRRAQGDLERATSNHAAAHSAYARLSDAARTRAGLVAQQELDDSQAKDLEAEAQVSSAKASLSSAEQSLEMAQANQKQVSALSDYTHISAPFAGVITNRYADTGTLVAAGTSSSTQANPVVRLAQISVLRLVLQIPESVAPQIHIGGSIKVHVQALNEDYEGKVSRFADSLDQQTRTMETEVDFQNSAGKLIPGMFCETYFLHSKKTNVLTIPVEAVLRTGDETTVLVVDAQNGVKTRAVKLGQESSSYVEVLSGLSEGERTIIGNPSAFTPGQKVSPKVVEAATTGQAGTN